MLCRKSQRGVPQFNRESKGTQMTASKVATKTSALYISCSYWIDKDSNVAGRKFPNIFFFTYESSLRQSPAHFWISSDNDCPNQRDSLKDFRFRRIGPFFAYVLTPACHRSTTHKVSKTTEIVVYVVQLTAKNSIGKYRIPWYYHNVDWWPFREHLRLSN